METKNVQFQSTEALVNVRRRIECDFQEVEAEHPRILRLALNEAEALADQTGFPQLVFPTLAAEKAQAVSTWLRRQKSIRTEEPSASFAE